MLNILDSLIANRNLLARSKENLRGLKRASKALQTLQSSLNVKVSHLEPTVTGASYHCAFNDLPDEILLAILKHAWPAWHHELEGLEYWRFPWQHEGYTRRRRSIRQFCLVNRRFREVIYGTPTFWNDLGFERKSEKIRPEAKLKFEATITRNHTMSKACGQFQILLEKSSVEKVMPCITQCTHLFVQSYGLNFTDLGRLEQDKISNVRFPNVTHLAVGDYWKDGANTFFSNWIFPSLQHLTINTFNLPALVPDSLTSLIIRDKRDELRHTSSSSLVLLLQKTPLLEMLHFECEIYSDDEYAQTIHLSNDFAHLLRLSSCIITIQIYVDEDGDTMIDDVPDEEIRLNISRRLANVTRYDRI